MPPTRHHLHLRFGRLLSDRKRPLLVTHEHADGDALGSLVGLGCLLRNNARTVTLFAPEAILSGFSHLEGLPDVRTRIDEVQLEDHDVVIMLDCGDVKRTKLAEQLYILGAHKPTVAIIDHHETRTVFRDRDLVDFSIVERSVSSTCELVYEYAVANGATITPEIATALLTGIVTDTGGFSNLGTTLASLDIASELMKRGANLRKIVAATVRSKSVGTLQLWGRALSRLERDPETDIVSTALTLKDFEECDVNRDASEGIASFLNNLGEGKVVLVLREEPKGYVKGSYRTKQPDVDVTILAKRFHGGGHVKAAGFTTAGKIVKKAYGWAVEPSPTPEG